MYNVSVFLHQYILQFYEQAGFASMCVEGVSKKPQPFSSRISQRWFGQINCPFGMVSSIAIQFFRVQF